MSHAVLPQSEQCTNCFGTLDVELTNLIDKCEKYQNGQLDRMIRELSSNPNSHPGFSYDAIYHNVIRTMPMDSRKVICVSKEDVYQVAIQEHLRLHNLPGMNSASMEERNSNIACQYDNINVTFMRAILRKCRACKELPPSPEPLYLDQNIRHRIEQSSMMGHNPSFLVAYGDSLPYQTTRSSSASMPAPPPRPFAVPSKAGAGFYDCEYAEQISTPLPTSYPASNSTISSAHQIAINNYSNNSACQNANQVADHLTNCFQEQLAPLEPTMTSLDQLSARHDNFEREVIDLIKQFKTEHGEKLAQSKTAQDVVLQQLPPVFWSLQQVEADLEPLSGWQDRLTKLEREVQSLKQTQKLAYDEDASKSERVKKRKTEDSRSGTSRVLRSRPRPDYPDNTSRRKT